MYSSSAKTQITNDACPRRYPNTWRHLVMQLHIMIAWQNAQPTVQVAKHAVTVK